VGPPSEGGPSAAPARAAVSCRRRPCRWSGPPRSDPTSPACGHREGRAARSTPPDRGRRRDAVEEVPS
jgi:hypothetical protein